MAQDTKTMKRAKRQTLPYRKTIPTGESCEQIYVNTVGKKNELKLIRTSIEKKLTIDQTDSRKYNKLQPGQRQTKHSVGTHHTLRSECLRDKFPAKVSAPRLMNEMGVCLAPAVQGTCGHFVKYT